MLGSYMEDIGMAPEQFESACGKSTANIKDKIHQVLLRVQIILSDNLT